MLDVGGLNGVVKFVGDVDYCILMQFFGFVLCINGVVLVYFVVCGCELLIFINGCCCCDFVKQGGVVCLMVGLVFGDMVVVIGLCGGDISIN